MATDKQDDAIPGPTEGSAAAPVPATPPADPAASAQPAVTITPPAADTPASADQPAAAPVGKTPAPPAPKARANTGLWILLLSLLLIVAALAWAGWTRLQAETAARQQLEAGLAQQEQRWQSLQGSIGQMSSRQQEQQSGWSASLQGVEQRLEEHSRRLRSLSTTTREDWLLAEVEYLLRLANQRLQMERGTVGALGLLQAADQILLELDDSELFPVRDKLARDIAALRLTPAVDRSGLYLELAALAEQIEQLPELPRMAPVTAAAAEQAAADATTAAAAEVGFVNALQAHFWAAMDKLKDQVRIRHNDQALEPLLPPDGARYLRQNIRFNLEQAQLAMLREETAVYRHSLQQAEQLLRQYFALQPAALVIANRLQALAQTDVQVQLPSIAGSLTALQEYIRKLHLLDDRAGRPQLQPEAASPEAPADAQPQEASQP